MYDCPAQQSGQDFVVIVVDNVNTFTINTAIARVGRNNGNKTKDKQNLHDAAWAPRFEMRLVSNKYN